MLCTALAATLLPVAVRPDLARAAPTPPELDDPTFYRLSQAATGHAEINRTTAARTLAAIRKVEPELVPRLAALAGLVQESSDPEALLAAANRGGLADAMHTLVAAWYTGTVGRGGDAQTIAYFDALMWRTVSDGLPVPTYCLQSGIWWEAAPPAANVPPPTLPPGKVSP